MPQGTPRLVGDGSSSSSNSPCPASLFPGSPRAPRPGPAAHRGLGAGSFKEDSPPLLKHLGTPRTLPAPGGAAALARPAGSAEQPPWRVPCRGPSRRRKRGRSAEDASGLAGAAAGAGPGWGRPGLGALRRLRGRGREPGGLPVPGHGAAAAQPLPLAAPGAAAARDGAEDAAGAAWAGPGCGSREGRGAAPGRQGLCSVPQPRANFWPVWAVPGPAVQALFQKSSGS